MNSLSSKDTTLLVKMPCFKEISIRGWIRFNPTLQQPDAAATILFSSISTATYKDKNYGHLPSIQGSYPNFLWSMAVYWIYVSNALTTDRDRELPLLSIYQQRLWHDYTEFMPDKKYVTKASNVIPPTCTDTNRWQESLIFSTQDYLSMKYYYFLSILVYVRESLNEASS